ncbi:MAG: dTMP kinase [Fimbriimonadaceae bacterium]|nr:dTMP kinase [Chthonomonadaceae bacterium]MCO5296136.1 dTMP kinase [Fimbriimonadaceae bacterium]
MFATFEGPEGAGKSTAIRAVAAHLEAEGCEVVVTREPGGGSIGPAIREILLHGPSLQPSTEVFLFLADRAQHSVEVIRPSLDAGKVVLCDRFADSTVVYQGHARGFDVERLRAWNDLATGGLRPDITLLFDLEPEVGLARLANKDRMDAEPLAFHRRVRAGFLAEAERDPDRWVVLDASQDQESLARAAVLAIDARLKK